MPRILLPPEVVDAALSGEEFDLDPETSKKLTRVLRLTPGETFIGFDGRGREWECALAVPDEEQGNRNRARAVVLEERPVESLQRLQISVAQAIPKGDKMDFVLQKGTELGIAEFWPFEAQRSVSRLLNDDEPERATGRAERWRRIVAAAAGQCGRADVPLVHAIADFATAVDYGTSNSRCFMLDERPETELLRDVLQRDPLQPDAEAPAKVMLLVGPEGGWTEREREWADRYGVEPVGLGRLVLRTETAALAAAAILQWEAGVLG
jgi:16S rRNA (uracil1498-N3)-methyltransferase